tara:strand:+ start:680 stop:1108 length:429 start_codon:yes stop_codon:yes gene_type:complete
VFRGFNANIYNIDALFIGDITMAEREPAWSLNIYTLTQEAHHKLWELDRSFIGTEHYMGLAYFHHYGYRHILRDDPSIAQRRRIHAELLKRGLKVNEMSKEHNEVIAKYMTGTISSIGGTPWTKEEILNYRLEEPQYKEVAK